MKMKVQQEFTITMSPEEAAEILAAEAVGCQVSDLNVVFFRFSDEEVTIRSTPIKDSPPRVEQEDPTAKLLRRTLDMYPPDG